ncbi:hypothetical protein JTE90_005401 [Oedothorax gibbosus]|uniref:Uncharacterized protein n=1 Tax=Oedothorax gibbosus TaxID=931172 RepID=A0AAV6U393_9ARAC|nr:hypothetical protein JTE90_005401 [Oedothorax gibbosus]
MVRTSNQAIRTIGQTTRHHLSSTEHRFEIIVGVFRIRIDHQNTGQDRARCWNIFEQTFECCSRPGMFCRLFDRNSNFDPSITRNCSMQAAHVV